MLFEIFAAEQLAEGKYIAEVEMILKWEKKGQKRMSIGEAADFFDASLPEINSIITLCKEHPDWTAEQIATEMD